MRYTLIQNDDNTWNLTDTATGETVLRDESYQVASNVQAQLNSGKFEDTECGEIATSILEAFVSDQIAEARRDSAKQAAAFKPCARCGADRSAHPIYGVCAESR